MPETRDKSRAQEAAEANVESFREDLGPFVVAAETTRMAMVFADAKEPGRPIIFANDAFLSLTGYHREEVLGQDFNFMLAHAADPVALAKVEAEIEGRSDARSELLYRRKDRVVTATRAPSNLLVAAPVLLGGDLYVSHRGPP